MFKNKQMQQAAVFYKNDKPEGFGFWFNQDVFPGFDKSLAIGMQEMQEHYAKATKKQRNEMFRNMKSDVAEYAKIKGTASIQDSLCAFLNVWFLEKHNKMPSDEFNGCTFAYET